jgi:hypothetical protein
MKIAPVVRLKSESAARARVMRPAVFSDLPRLTTGQRDARALRSRSRAARLSSATTTRMHGSYVGRSVSSRIPARGMRRAGVAAPRSDPPGRSRPRGHQLTFVDHDAASVRREPIRPRRVSSFGKR